MFSAYQRICDKEDGVETARQQPDSTLLEVENAAAFMQNFYDSMTGNPDE